MKKGIISAVIAIIMFTATVLTSFSQTQEFVPPANRIGFSASMMSGLGLTYQHNFNPLAVKFVAFYYFYKNGTGDLNNTTIIGPSYNYNSKGEYGSFGLELKYYVFNSKYVNVYPFAGISYWIDNTETPSSYWTNNNTYSYLNTNYSKMVRTGAGLGVELIAGKYIVFNFDIGFNYFNNNRDMYDHYSSPQKTTSQDLYFGIGVGGGVAFAF